MTPAALQQLYTEHAMPGTPSKSVACRQRRTPIIHTEFTAARHLESGKLQRMTLTRRHATRMSLPPVAQARRAMAQRTAPVYAPDGRERAGFNWSALSSVLLMVAMVALAVACTRIRL